MERKNIIKIELLEDYRKSHNMTKAEFCKFCNISVGIYRKMLAGKTPRKIRTIYNILCATKIRSCDLLGV